MYYKIQECLNGRIGDLRVSAILSTNEGGFEVGTPCIADFTNIQVKKPLKNSDATTLFKTEKDVPKALNEFLAQNIASVPNMFIFTNRVDIPIGHIGMTHGYALHCIKVLPIVNDTGKHTVVKRFDNIVSSHNLSEVPEKVAEYMKKYRYVNYVVEDICRSKINSTIDNLQRLSTILAKKYPNNTCVQIRGNGQSTLIDTLSISFYRLQDVMPIFDYNRAAGIAVEILLTNSMLSGHELLGSDGNHMAVRWVFSRYKDNIFTIDGERIRRQF